MRSARPVAIAAAGPLRDAHEAGEELRRACRVDALAGVSARLVAGLAIGAVGVLVATQLFDVTPRATHAALAAVLLALLAVAVPLRPYRAALRDARELRSGIITAVPGPGAVCVRGVDGGVWSWTYRRRLGMRPLLPGERVWVTGRGEWEMAPTVVVARAVRGRDHVLWPIRARTCDRLPDPDGDRDVDDEHPYDGD